MIDLGIAALVFGPIFLLELPDKTFVATLVLSTRYRPLAVWIGVGAAFGVQCVVAVTAGHAIGYLPDWVVHSATLVIFCVGAVLLIRSAPSAAAGEQEQEAEYAERVDDDSGGRTFRRATITSFLVIFAAEWGDLSQLFTASFASRHGHPLSVFVGSWLALLAVSGLAALAGRWLVRRMPLSLLHYIGAAVCIGFAAWTAYELVASV